MTVLDAWSAAEEQAASCWFQSCISASPILTVGSNWREMVSKFLLYNLKNKNKNKYIYIILPTQTAAKKNHIKKKEFNFWNLISFAS